MIIDVILEQHACYISRDYEVYSDAPDYIKQMAEDANSEARELGIPDIFTFTEEESGWGDNPAPPVVEARKKVKEKYFN